MDGPPELGGNNMGVRPMEMLLLGMGGCTSIDVMQILQKGRNNSSSRPDSPRKHWIVTLILLSHKLAGKR
jgi:hypothetical protein